EAIEPSGSAEFPPSKATLSGAAPKVGEAVSAATGGWFALAAGSTNKVTLWGGRVAAKLLPVKLTSARRVMAFAAVRRQTWALPLCGKLAMLSVAGVLPERYLLITMIVSAPSLERSAANTETLSGFGPEAATLVSPKVDLLPS